MKSAVVTIVFILTFSFIKPVNSTMSGGDFEIISDAFSVNSVDPISGGSFDIYSTAGEIGATSTDGGNYVLRGGFQAQEQSILAFTISNTSLNLGELSNTSVSSANTVVSVWTGSDTGYSLTLSENGELRTSEGFTIDDVSDGEVTAGREEYGISVSGQDRAFGNHRGISGSMAIASAGTRVTARQSTITFHASRSGATQPGSYSHGVSFTLTVNP